jgi:hypothetical protein
MTGSCSSFSVATTVFVSLAICAVISYGVFYYFKQRLSVIEQSQMEQARIMQALISRGLAQQQGQQQTQQTQQLAQQVQQQQQAHDQLVACHKEITITQNGLIEVSSDSDSEDTESETSDSESESGESESGESESGESEAKCSDKWSIGDEIHNSDSIYETNAHETDAIESIDIDTSSSSSKKIISLNKHALRNDDDDEDDDDEADADDASTSSSEHEQAAEHVPDFEVKIGYKTKKDANEVNDAKTMNLNYNNMSVSALRQLAKERGLGGEDVDLQKLKKKDLVQLLQ